MAKLTKEQIIEKYKYNVKDIEYDGYNNPCTDRKSVV